MNNITADEVMEKKTDEDNVFLDATGLICPEPVMIIRKTIRSMRSNAVLHIIADDPATKRDVNSFCEFMGHKLLRYEIESIPYQYWVKKG